MEPVHIGIAAESAALRAGLLALLGEEPEFSVTTVHVSAADFLSHHSMLDLLVWVPDRRDAAGLRDRIGLFGEVPLLLLVDERSDLGALADRFGSQPVGVLAVEASLEEIVAAIHALREGLSVGNPALLAVLMGKPAANRLEDELAEPLTPRELQVLQRLAEGLTNKQIALALGISEHTAKFHISSIYSKLGVMNRAEVVQVGIRRGLIVV